MASFDEFVFGGLNLSLEEELHEESESLRNEQLSHFLIKCKKFSFGEIFLKIESSFKEVLNSSMGTPFKPLFGGFL
jgi:hypothetical protein